MKKICLLGATGSVGRQTVEILESYPEKFSLKAMSFGKNVSFALEIIHKFQPELVSAGSQSICEELKRLVPSHVRVVWGQEGLIEAATYHNVDIVLNAVLGSVGLEPTLAAIEAGKTLAFANKETLVTAGHLVMEAAAKNKVTVLPVDSEHSAIFQCLQGEKKEQISRLIVTASGGSFRDKSRKELEGVTVDEALNHPNWSMGKKITIDSATMMNKGLEVIEAHWLFGIPFEQIDVLIHRESIIHSMVEFIDSSVIAQLGMPDMRTPIQYALTYPDRLELKEAKRLNLGELGKLHFGETDFDRYRCLGFAFEAGRMGGTMPTVLNAANEEAVSLFLDGQITFLDIENKVEAAIERHNVITTPELDVILEVDKDTRAFVRRSS